MRTITTIKELRSALAPLRLQSKTIGFVPTMGALHDGHVSLVQLSKVRADVTVVSIFVNPTQFGPNEDFTVYPRTLEEDTSLLVDKDVEFLFLPTAEEIYPSGHTTSIQVDEVTEMFEGSIRPHHFRGVATVVASLFNIVQPDIAFFGQKDAQQVAVIKRMVRDLHFPIQIQVGSTIREKDGLAMSSRNRYLSEEDRTQSSALNQTLLFTKNLLENGKLPSEAEREGIEQFKQLAPGQTLDYLAIVDSETFQRPTSFEAGKPAHGATSRAVTIIIAARIGNTRLIDNIVVGG